MVKKNAPKIYPVLIILAVSLWPLYLYMITGKAIFGDTIAAHFPPLKFNAVQTMLEGNLPLWNPHIFAGMPLLGDSTSDPFDVLNIVYLVFNPLLATIMFTALQLFLAGLFMYLYLKICLRLDKYSCLLGGIVYMLNPSFLSGAGARLDFMTAAGTIIWLPLIMLLIDKALERGPRFLLYSLLAGAALALSFFGGSANLVLFIGFFISLYIFFSPRAFKKKIAAFFIISGVSLLISSVQIFPTFNTAGLSNRTSLWPHVSNDLTGLSVPSFFISIFEFPVGRFLNVFNIEHLGDIVRNYQSWYIGVFNLLLVLLMYFKRAVDYKIRFYKIFIPAFLAFLICMFYLPIRGLITALCPFLKGVKVGHSIFLLHFSAIILIARVFDDLIRPNGWPAGAGKFIGLFVKTALPVMLLLSIAVVFAGASPDRYDYICVLLCFALLSASLLVLYRTVKAAKKVKPELVYILSLLIILNMALEWGIGYGRQRSYKILPAHFKESAETRFLKSMQPWERVEILYNGRTIYDLAFSRDQYFGFNLPLFYRAHILGGSHPLHSGRARVFFDMINNRYPFDRNYYWKGDEYVNPTGRAWLEGRDINFNLIHLSGVKYLLSPVERREGFLKLKARGDSYFIYENLRALPRAFLVHGYEVLNEKELLDKLNNSGFRPLKTVLLEEPVGSMPKGGAPYGYGAAKVTAEIVLYKPNEVTIKTASGRDEMLVFTDAYDKDWKVYVDGDEEKIYRADYLFRAVAVPKGEHSVTFRYAPKSFFFIQTFFSGLRSCKNRIYSKRQLPSRIR